MRDCPLELPRSLSGFWNLYIWRLVVNAVKFFLDLDTLDFCNGLPKVIKMIVIKINISEERKTVLGEIYSPQSLVYRFKKFIKFKCSMLCYSRPFMY